MILEITFPKLLLCSNSIHSRAKLNKLYPDLTDKDVWKLYGQATSKRTREFWNKLVISNVRTEYLILTLYFYYVRRTSFEVFFSHFTADPRIISYIVACDDNAIDCWLGQLGQHKSNRALSKNNTPLLCGALFIRGNDSEF